MSLCCQDLYHSHALCWVSPLLNNFEGFTKRRPNNKRKIGQDSNYTNSGSLLSRCSILEDQNDMFLVFIQHEGKTEQRFLSRFHKYGSGGMPIVEEGDGYKILDLNSSGTWIAVLDALKGTVVCDFTIHHDSHVLKAERNTLFCAYTWPLRIEFWCLNSGRCLGSITPPGPCVSPFSAAPPWTEPHIEVPRQLLQLECCVAVKLLLSIFPRVLVQDILLPYLVGLQNSDVQLPRYRMLEIDLHNYDGLMEKQNRRLRETKSRMGAAEGEHKMVTNEKAEEEANPWIRVMARTTACRWVLDNKRVVLSSTVGFMSTHYLGDSNSSTPVQLLQKFRLEYPLDAIRCSQSQTSLERHTVPRAKSVVAMAANQKSLFYLRRRSVITCDPAGWTCQPKKHDFTRQGKVRTNFMVPSNTSLVHLAASDKYVVASSRKAHMVVVDASTGEILNGRQVIYKQDVRALHFVNPQSELLLVEWAEPDLCFTLYRMDLECAVQHISGRYSQLSGCGSLFLVDSCLITGSLEFDLERGCWRRRDFPAQLDVAMDVKPTGSRLITPQSCIIGPKCSWVFDSVQD